MDAYAAFLTNIGHVLIIALLIRIIIGDKTKKP